MKPFFIRFTIVSIFIFSLVNLSFCAEESIWRNALKKLEDKYKEIADIDDPRDVIEKLPEITESLSKTLKQSDAAYKIYKSEMDKQDYKNLRVAFSKFKVFAPLKQVFDIINKKQKIKKVSTDFVTWFINGIDSPPFGGELPLIAYTYNFSKPNLFITLILYGTKKGIGNIIKKPDFKLKFNFSDLPQKFKINFLNIILKSLISNSELKDVLDSHNLSIDEFLKNINQHIDKKNGMTLLMYAANLGLYNIVYTLIQAGADPLIKTNTDAPNIPPNWTALDFAESRYQQLSSAKQRNINELANFKNTIEIIRSYILQNLIAKSELKDILEVHKVSIDEFLKNINQDIDKKNGMTLLMYAANLGLVDAVKVLLDLGADPSITTKSDAPNIPPKWTALNFAESRGFKNIIEILSKKTKKG